MTFLETFLKKYVSYQHNLWIYHWGLNFENSFSNDFFLYLKIKKKPYFERWQMLLSNQFLFWDQAISVIGSKMASYVLGLIYNVDFLDDAQVLFNFFLFEKKKKIKILCLGKTRGGLLSTTYHKFVLFWKTCYPAITSNQASNLI